MGTAAVYIYLILSALTPSVTLVVVHDVWPDVGDGFISQSLLSSDPIPSQMWNFIDFPSGFALRVTNSSWSGPAKTIYQRGDSVYLQASGSSAQGQELFIQSCFVTTSSNSMDTSRAALILNKGCVSSKHSAVEFISRQRDSINLLLNTSSLTFPQVYVHCSVVPSAAVTSDTKSCNYNRSKSLWVELSGQTNVCACCASKCKGPPASSGLSDGLKALVSTGPLTIMEVQQKEHSQSNSSMGMNQNGSTRLLSSMETGWIVASATISDNAKMNVPYSLSWLSQPVVTAGLMAVNQDPGVDLSLWLPGLLLDIAPDPVFERVIDRQQKGAASVGVFSQDGASSDAVHAGTLPEVKNQTAHDWKSLIPEQVSEVYMADSPGLRNDWDLEGFHSPEEELRGDVFMNDKWLQQYHQPDEVVQVNALVSPLLEKLPEKPQDDKVLKQEEPAFQDVTGAEFGKLEYVKKTTMTFRQAVDGSSSLSYEEEERLPSVWEQEVKKSKLEVKRRKVDEEKPKDSKETEKTLMWSLYDVVRGLQKSMNAQ